MFFKIIFFLSLVSNLILIVVVNSNDKPSEILQGDLLVASDSEKQCIENNSNHRIVFKENLYGPDYLSGYSIIRVESKYLEDSFEFRYSNCFYDSYIEVMDGNSIDIAVELYKSRGLSNITVHKQGEKSFTTVTAR